MNEKKSLPLRRDLGSQILLFYIIFVLLVIVAILFFERSASRRLAADVNAANLALASAVAEETSTQMSGALQAVQELSTYPEVISADTSQMDVTFRTLMTGRREINLTYRLGADGTMLFHYPVAPESTVGRDFSFRDYFQKALGVRTPFVSKGRISPTTNEAVATALMPIWVDNTFRGLVATNMQLQSLSDALSNIAQEYGREEGFRIFIVDSSGQIVAHSDPFFLLTDARSETPEVIDAVLSRQRGNLVAADASGAEQLYSYVPIKTVGWGVVISRPVSVAFATLYAFRRGALVAVLVFLASGVLFWRDLSHRVIRPIERLANFSVEGGTDDERDSNAHAAALAALTARPDQMGLLTRSLTSMQQAIEARLNEVSTLLETSAAVVSSLDHQTVLERILEQVERLLGTDMSAIFALDEEQKIFRVSASRGLPQWYTERATIDPDEPGSVTMRAIRVRRPIQVSDTETNPSFKLHRDRARSAGYRSVLAVPILSQHTKPAALLVFRREAHEFSRREINLLTSFANHATMAIENAALFAQSDTQLQEQTHRLQALIQSMQDGLILENLDGRVQYVNRSVQELSGLAPAAFESLPAKVLMDHILAHAQDRGMVEEDISKAIDEGKSRWVRFSLDGPDGTRHWRLTIFDVKESDGSLIGRGRILQDITQRYELDRMKSSLIATVSHELRTPLAAIKGYASTLLAEDVEWDPVSQRDFLEIISTETDHLRDLVNDLLDMSRIESGTLTVSRIACDLSELVERAVWHAHPHPGTRLQLDLPLDLPPLFADPKRITVVLRNLIENAVKYGGDQTPVIIEASWDEHQVVVRVRDEGPGISVQEGERIFQSFYRVEGGLTQRTSGAGLGLAISKGFIEAHKGKIWTESQERGLCVAFTLPLVLEDAGVTAHE